MPRLARTVFAGVPHHITQCGNRQENVFFTQADRQLYLEWLKEYTLRYNSHWATTFITI
jgi:putative transposase